MIQVIEQKIRGLRLTSVSLILLALPLACGPRRAVDIANYDSWEEALRVRSLQLESELPPESEEVADSLAHSMNTLVMMAAVLSDQPRFGTRTGRFNFQVFLDNAAEGSYKLSISGLDERAVRHRLEGTAADDRSSIIDGVVFVVTPDEPPALLPKSAEIWSTWQRAKAVAIQVVVTPPASTVVEDAASFRRLLSLDPARWRSDSIRMLITGEGLELDSIPANLPE